MDNLIKVSFLGDIMCEQPQLKASKRDGGYEFDKMFDEIRGFLSKSDYVIGNLETPIAKNLIYTRELYSFNTPPSFLDSLKNANIDLLITANNHCLDRGKLGLNMTMKQILKNGLEYTGTSLYKGDQRRTKIININDLKVGILSYTYGTNYGYNKYKLHSKDRYKVNLLKKQNSNPKWDDYNKLEFLKQFFYINFLLPIRIRITKNIPPQVKLKIKNILGKVNEVSYLTDTDSFNKSVVIDKLNEGEWVIDSDILNKIQEDIIKLKEESDIVIFTMHSGGQFNDEPGSFTTEIVNIISEMGVDLIIGTHPHIVQKIEKQNNIVTVYSLGNFTISPSTEYLNPTNLPEYSIVLNLYLDKKTKNTSYITFSICKIIDIRSTYSKVFLVSELIRNERNNELKSKLIKDSLFIYNRVTRQNLQNIEIENEYILDFNI